MDVSVWYQRFEKLLPAIIVAFLGYGLTTLNNIDKNIGIISVRMEVTSTVLENTNKRLDLIKNDIAAIRVDTMLK